MLPVLLTQPQSQTDWDRFSFHHRSSHDAIRAAIQQQKGVTLPDYILDPIALDQPKQFLEANQQAHSDMDSVLGVQGSDLEDVDINDARQMRAWIYLHWIEHQTAEQTLGIAS